MKLGTYVICAVKILAEKKIFAGKTNIQKLIYFALPDEQRKKLYHPYHYGPYCEDVQHVVGTLVKKRELSQINGGLRFTGESKSHESMDAVVERMKVAADFFVANGFTTTDSIAQLSKVHLLSGSRHEEAKRDVINHICSQAKFLGWKELAGAGVDEIRRCVEAADTLNRSLKAADGQA